MFLLILHTLFFLQSHVHEKNVFSAQQRGKKKHQTSMCKYRSHLNKEFKGDLAFPNDRKSPSTTVSVATAGGTKSS